MPATRNALLLAPAAIVTIALAGCGGTDTSADASTSPAREAAAAAPAQITCPERTSETWPITLKNGTGVRLTLTTDPATVNCSAWSATGNPSNLNEGGGRQVLPGKSSKWLLEMASRKTGSGAYAWTSSIEDADLGTTAGTITLGFREVWVQDDLVRTMLQMENPAGSGKWVCGDKSPVVVGTLRGRDLVARISPCVGSGRTLTLFTR